MILFIIDENKSFLLTLGRPHSNNKSTISWIVIIKCEKII